MRKLWKKIVSILLITAMAVVLILPTSTVSVSAGGGGFSNPYTTEVNGITYEIYWNTIPYGKTGVPSDLFDGLIVDEANNTVKLNGVGPDLLDALKTLKSNITSNDRYLYIYNIDDDYSFAVNQTGLAKKSNSDITFYNGYITDVKHVHSAEKVEGQAATCTADGYEDAYYCAGCQKYFTDEACTDVIGDENDYNTWKTGAGKIASEHVIPESYKSDKTYHWLVCDRCHEEIPDTRGVHGGLTGEGFEYVVEDSKIVEKCIACGYVTGEITLTVPENAVYDGQSYGASWNNSTHVHVITLVYEMYNGTDWETIDYVPTNAGKYRASITAGGKTLTKEFTIAKAKVDVPTAKSGLVYNGNDQIGVDYSEVGIYSLSGIKAVNAGQYTATVSLDDKNNYEWSTGTSEDQSIEWIIDRAKVDIPTAIEGLVYNGDNQVGVNYDDSGIYVMYASTQNRYAGDYEARARLNDTNNYEWADGTTTYKKINWSIAKKEITISWDSDSFEYDGEAHLPTPIASDTNAEIVTDLSDGYIDVGEYTVTASLKPDSLSEINYTITSGTTQTFTITGYKITSGANGKITKGSISDYSITANGPYDKFQGLKIDDEFIVRNSDYTDEPGSTIITFKKAYLETLSVGTHNVEMIWTNGSATTTITIKATPVTPYVVPKTGVN